MESAKEKKKKALDTSAPKVRPELLVICSCTCLVIGYVVTATMAGAGYLVIDPLCGFDW